MKRVITVFVAIMVASGVYAPTSVADPQRSSERKEVRKWSPEPTPHYLLQRFSSRVRTSGEDQCILPVEERTGNWMCLEGEHSAETTTPARMFATAEAAGGFCNGNGACWFPIDHFFTNNDLVGTFGYDNEELGKATMWMRNSLNGGRMDTKTGFKTTTGTRDLVAIGDALRGDSDTQGIRVEGKDKYAQRSGLSAGTEWKPFGTDGYYSVVKNYGQKANVIDYEWGKGGYPGRWWMYQKCLIAKDQDMEDSVVTYKFTLNPDFRFKVSAKTGWDPV